MVEFAEHWATASRRGGEWAQALSNGFEASVRQALGVDPPQKPNLFAGIMRPDVVIDGEGRVPTLAIEIKIWSNASKFLSNRLNETLVSSARYRDDFASEIELGLLLALPDSKALEPEHILRRFTALIRRAKDEVGFDSVAVGSGGSQPVWFVLDRDGIRKASNFKDAVIRLSARVQAARVDNTNQRSLETSDEPLQREGASVLKLLLVADEWTSQTGGISTFNREFASALSAAGCDVRVVVPFIHDGERDAASAQGVTLVMPNPVPGVNGAQLLLMRPIFNEADYYPDVVVGHGRILGPYAYAIRNQFFPNAKRLHVVHTDAESLEAAKEVIEGPSRMGLASERLVLEMDLARSADLVAGVGPLLSASVRHELRGTRGPIPDVLEIRPGLRDWDGMVDPTDPPAIPQILLIARAEDIQSKGIDLGIAAVNAARTILQRTATEQMPLLVIRGVPLSESNTVKKEIEKLSDGFNVRLRPYSSDQEVLRRDLFKASVVIMPSRHEGFGLAAYEAIAAGVPVLISAKSGLAQMLLDTSDREPSEGLREILAVDGAAKEDIALEWGRALRDILVDPHGAFDRARDLHGRISEKVTWASTVDDVIAAIRVLEDDRESV